METRPREPRTEILTVTQSSSTTIPEERNGTQSGDPYVQGAGVKYGGTWPAKNPTVTEKKPSKLNWIHLFKIQPRIKVNTLYNSPRGEKSLFDKERFNFSFQDITDIDRERLISPFG